MRRYLALMLISMAFAVTGCESCDSCQGVGPGTGGSEGEPGDPTEIGGAIREDAGQAAPDEIESSEQPSIRQAASDFAEVMKEIGKAYESGIDAEEGESFCERALTGTHGAIKYLNERATDSTKTIVPPNSLIFMHVCEGLPLDAQRCMVLSYSAENDQECSRVFDELPAEKREQLQKLRP